jgi:hypothetical protein
MLTIRQSSVGSWHVIHEWYDTYLYLSCWLEDNLLSVPETCDPWMAWYIPVLMEPTEDCLLVNMISTGMYHAIHGSHVSGTDRRLSYSQHDKYRYVSCHSTYLYLSCWLEDNLLSVPETCDPWMAWYIPVLIMLTRRQSSVGSLHVIHEWHDTDRRLSYNQHDKYMYVSCHSWITCQEPTGDCLLVNMISTGMYHAIYGSHVRNRQKIVLNGMIHTSTYHVD